MVATIRDELTLIWQAQLRAGLNGKMCLYSLDTARPWPAKTPGLRFWFGPDEIDAAVAFFDSHYNNATFPFTTLLLLPIVYQQVSETEFQPVGSAVYWASALTIDPVPQTTIRRLNSLGVMTGEVERGQYPQSGLKLVAFSETPLPLTADGTVAGCRELYQLANVDGDELWPYYLLSGVSYLSGAGSYVTPPLVIPPDVFAKHSIVLQSVQEAAACWEAYDRHHGLYERFGNDYANLTENLKFYHYCARDFELFDAIGPQSMKTNSQQEGGFDFLVHGLIPRGSIVLLAGTGGTGKSSIAHKLCCLAATDWRDDEQPMWLGQPVNKKSSKGICVYFSGEDGPAIINARNELFDPAGRAKRLMFQRNHFVDREGGEISFAKFLDRLRTMPEVPLLVVDPARKYLTGDEEDAAVVSEFFEAIERFAHERNSAVIVVHHLSKGAKPTTAREVLDELRGSQVFIDRPRVVIGMFREGPTTVVGLAKCNIPPSLGMVTVERVFAHNPKTLDLTQLPGEKGIRDPYQVPADDEE